MLALYLVTGGGGAGVDEHLEATGCLVSGWLGGEDTKDTEDTEDTGSASAPLSLKIAAWSVLSSWFPPRQGW